jgi:hypothetical protein
LDSSVVLKTYNQKNGFGASKNVNDLNTVAFHFPLLAMIKTNFTTVTIFRSRYRWDIVKQSYLAYAKSTLPTVKINRCIWVRKGFTFMSCPAFKNEGKGM